jgi:hypothetical protein
MSSLAYDSNYNKNKNERWCFNEYVFHVNSYIKRNYPNNTNNIKNIKKCFHGKKCWNAHSSSEIKLYPYLVRFNNTDKKNINLYENFIIIKNLLIRNKSKMKLEDKNIISRTDLNDFMKVLELWRNMNSKYSRILQSWKPNYEGYKFKHEIPNLEFKNEESDIIWGLYKYTRKCEDYEKLKDDIIKNIKLDPACFCRRDLNCKNGCHDLTKLICISDLLTGSCNCKNRNINSLRKEIEKMKNEDKDISKKLKELGNCKLHLTLEGLIPFNISKENSEKKNLKIESSKLDTNKLNLKIKEGFVLENIKKLSFLNKK